MARVTLKKSKIYHPKNEYKGFVSPGNDSFEKIAGRKKENIIPAYGEYLITDNRTNKYGNVVNRLDSNVELAKAEVDANKK